jgi:hypothetical protein
VATTPFKDFAKKLAEQMERERVDVRRNDKRETFTTYRVPKVAVRPIPVFGSSRPCRCTPCIEQSGAACR